MPASLAMAGIDVLTYPRSLNSRKAASRIASRTLSFLRWDIGGWASSVHCAAAPRIKNEWYSLLTGTETVSRVVRDGPFWRAAMEAGIRAQELNPGKLTSLYRKQFELCKVG